MNNTQVQILIATVASLLFIPFLGITHLFDWDEINFAECAREMIVSGNYASVQIGFLPFWEKPPLFFWLQVLSMKAFGMNEFAARFPNALAGVASLMILFHIGTKLYSQKIGLLWVFAYAGSFLPHFYFKSGIIDPLFNLFIFLSVYQLSMLSSTEREISKKRYKNALFGGIFLGLAILTKGPVALFLIGLCGLIYWVMSLSWKTFKIPELLVYGLLAILVSSVWYMTETVLNGLWFLQEFFDYQIGLATRSENTGHSQPFWYHPVVLLVGCFPTSIYFLKSFSKSTHESEQQKSFVLWMKLLFIVTLTVFSIVETKIVHYSSLCYFPLTFLAVHYLEKASRGETTFSTWQKVLLAFVGGLIGLLITIIAQVYWLKDLVIPYIKDDFAVANLSADVYWAGWEGIVGVLFIGLVMYAIFFAHQKSILKGAYTLFIATLITLQLTIYIFVPKIEQYSQKAAIDFMEEIKTEDAYIVPLGYKSYVHYYYGEVTPKDAAAQQTYLLKYYGSKEVVDTIPQSQQEGQWKEWLLTGEIDKTAYFITKVDKVKNYPQLDSLPKVKERNGFILYKRTK